MVRDLAPSAINDVSNFICHYKLEVLSCEFISNEKPILNFYSTDHIIGHSPHHHLLLHHLLLLKHSLDLCLGWSVSLRSLTMLSMY